MIRSLQISRKKDAATFTVDPQVAEPLPDGFEISPARMAEAAEKFGNVIVGPPR